MIDFKITEVDESGKKQKHRSSKVAAVLLFIGLGVGALETLAYIFASGDETLLAAKKFPFLHDIAWSFVQNWSDLWSAFRSTATGALVGLAVGTVIGVMIALLAARSRIWESAVYPYVVVGQMIPTIALAPIVLVVLRDVGTTRVVVASFITFFPISLNTLKGLKSVPADGAELMLSFNSSGLKTLWKFRIPAAMPFFFTGFKIAAPLAVVAEIVVELSGATTGVGYLILITQYYGPSFASFFWASVLLALLLGVLFYRAAVWLERAMTSWQPEFRS